LAKQDYKIITPNSELVFTVPGKNGVDDMKILTEFPKSPWAHSLYYIGVCLRLKGMVEDRNYPNAMGKFMLLDFCCDCITKRDVSILDICRKYKIPERE